MSGAGETDRERPSPWLWAAAAGCALLLHAGCVAFALTQLEGDIDEDSMGAPAIEIGLEMAAPRAEATDLPPGPDSDASAASPAVAAQQAVVTDTDLPKDKADEQDDPDRIVTEQDNRKPVVEEAEKAAVQAAPSMEAVASEATAMPSSEAIPQAQKSVAPAQGSGEAARRVKVRWQKELITHLDKHKRYPAAGDQKSAEIVVSFTLDRVGHVHAVSIVKGSGDPAFDDAALAMVRRSDPVPPPPPAIADEGLTFTLPVIFRVKGRG
jgi:TonB family protein